VQGDAAPLEIVAALRCLCRQAQPDVILLARGGGSLEDLWAFNDERVVRAVAAAPVPVITGVGHETDFTLVDFACDRRAPTPTGAAVAATPDRSDLQSDLISLTSQMGSAALRIVGGMQQELYDTSQRLERASPVAKIRAGRQAVDESTQRAGRAMAHMLQLKRAHLNGLHSRLLALSPAAVLQRGYAIVELANGKPVTSTRDAAVMEDITIRLRDGVLAARVTDVHTGERK
jgi:exodeoxyribonuclease VII large subunit